MSQPMKRAAPPAPGAAAEEKGARHKGGAQKAKGRFCIINVNDRGRLYLMALKARGAIDVYYHVGNARWCAEFSGELLLTFGDYAEVLPRYVLERKTLLDLEMEAFRTYIVLEAMRTLEGADVLDYSGTTLALKPTGGDDE